MKMTTSVFGIRETAHFLKKHRKAAQTAAKSGLTKAADDMYKKIIQNVSKYPVNSASLRRLGHPFAKDGASSPAVLGPEWAKKPWMIHKDKGNVVDSIKYHIRTGSKAPRAVFFYDYKETYVKYVIKGTSIMVGRDVIWQTMWLNRLKVKKQFRSQFFKAWNRDTTNLRKLFDSKKRWRGRRTNV